MGRCLAGLSSFGRGQRHSGGVSFPTRGVIDWVDEGRSEGTLGGGEGLLPPTHLHNEQKAGGGVASPLPPATSSRRGQTITTYSA
ncbi:hypothetical protein E2C01_044855 [Portunus trituberculatus]|uniref:Uncharacterized protein n=1 Tax=Portunus trituberculatus TaxID=210409 RepID=A0A5B7G1L4_PORTR|nr:hypothetical protein [Portunus trituberculatus]